MAEYVWRIRQSKVGQLEMQMSEHAVDGITRREALLGVGGIAAGAAPAAAGGGGASAGSGGQERE